MLKQAIVFLLLVLLPRLGLADGKVFAHRTAFAEPTIPDQRALICWSNGIERLVIETRFIGPGTNFAWVVPLPAKPLIEEATGGLFNTLAFQLRPQVVHRYQPLGPIFGLCLALGYLLLFVRQDGERSAWDVAVCGLAGACLMVFSPVAGLISFLLLVWTVERARRGRGVAGTLILLFVVILFLSGLLMPALGVRSKGGLTEGVTELERRRVGAFETATIASTDPAALMSWLRENEFSLPSNAVPVIADYVKRGWVFVAARLHTEAAHAATNSIHPLSFTFPASQAVYPLRLTGVDNPTLDVELYVFGMERAAAQGFKVERCSEVKLARESPRRSDPPRDFAAVHPLLQDWVRGMTIVTKLTATLSTEGMQTDAVLQWSPFEPKQTTLYSRRGAVLTALDWSLGLLFAAGFVAAMAMVVRPGWQRRRGRVAVCLSAGVLLVFGVVYLSLPKTTVREGLKFYPQFTLHDVTLMGELTTEDWERNPPSSLADARKVALAHRPARNNLILGGPVREEDSPGNYVIRQGTNGFEFAWFDLDATEHIVLPTSRGR